MGNKLYVGNLPFSATEETLTATFSQCGTVSSARIITDRDSGRSKGFGFVEMADAAEAQAAIEKFDGSDCEGRPMNVSIAKPMVEREKRGGFSNAGRRNSRGGW